MEYYNEEILEARWEDERRKHTTLETGIYVEDELITFSDNPVGYQDSSIFAGTVYSGARSGY